MADKREIKDEPEPASGQVKVKLQVDHIYLGKTYPAGVHTVEPELAEVLRASEARVAESRRKADETARRIQTGSGPVVPLEPLAVDDDDSVGSA